MMHRALCLFSLVRVSTRKAAEAWQKRNIYMKDFLSKTVLSLYVRLLSEKTLIFCLIARLFFSLHPMRENKTVIMLCGLPVEWTQFLEPGIHRP